MQSFGAKPLVVAYVAAAAAANLLVARFGQPALLFTAALLIPFDMVARDVLHERWQGAGLWWRMAALIGSGGLVALIINAASWRVAAASFLAFVAAGTVDMLAYQALKGKHRLVKMNASNAFSSVTDSVIFPIAAFASVSPLLSFSQAGVKLVGGLFWSIAFYKLQRGTR